MNANPYQPPQMVGDAQPRRVGQITCTPQSICSWDYRIAGLSSGPAALGFDFFTEQGSISLGGATLLVQKHGFLSGHWTLERGGRLYAEAQKPSVLFRSFEIRCGELQVTVQAQSPVTRSFDILAGGVVLGTIRPVHPFTRRAFIDCESTVPEVVQLFSFWLAVVTWRRAAKSNSS